MGKLTTVPSRTAGSASGPAAHGTLGKVSIPCSGRCSCSTAMRRCGDALVGVQCLAPASLRSIGTPVALWGTWRRNGSGCHQARVSPPPARSRSASALGSAHRTRNGSPSRSGSSIHRYNASGSHRRGTVARSAPRIADSAAKSVRQPFAVATGISPCSLQSTTWQSLGRPETRSHKSRSVLGFLP